MVSKRIAEPTPKRKPFVCVGLGEILFDLFPSGMRLGGAPANVAYHTHQMGIDSYVVSAVGNDELGTQITRQLQDIALSTRYIYVDRDHPTGTVSVSIDSAGQPAYCIHEGVAWDFFPFSMELKILAAAADVLVFGTLAQRNPISSATLRNCLRESRSGCLRVFDINLRQRYYSPQLIVELLAMSNVLKLNEEEFPIVSELLHLAGDEQGRLGQLLERFNLRCIALTKGARGSRIVTRSGESVRPNEPVQVRNTVGAGDAFTAGLIAGMLHDLPLASMHELCALLAAHTCEADGATPAYSRDFHQKASGLLI